MKSRYEILLELIFTKFMSTKESRFAPLFDTMRVEDASPKIRSKTFTISLEKILKGEDKRTSVMIKNLPNDVNKDYINKILCDVGNINYVYLPYDKNSSRSLGFAFVNVVNYKNIIKLYNKLNGIKLENFNMKRPLEICYSKVQGKLGLSQMFVKKIIN